MLETPLRLSLGSYNIHRCFGTDGRYMPERTVEVIEALDADIIGLQEVDMKLLVDGRAQLHYFAGELGMHAVAGPNVKGRRGKFGNALLSRWPVGVLRRVDLTVKHFEPRGAIDCELELPGGPLRVVVSHLGLNGGERRFQVRTLMAALNAHDRGLPTVIMGDFNEWRPACGALGPLDRSFAAAPMLRTFPSRLPLLPLDRIWASPRLEWRGVTTYATPLSRLTSDHLPLRTELWAGAAAGPAAALREPAMTNA